MPSSFSRLRTSSHELIVNPEEEMRANLQRSLSIGSTSSAGNATNVGSPSNQVFNMDEEKFSFNVAVEEHQRARALDAMRRSRANSDLGSSKSLIRRNSNELMKEKEHPSPLEEPCDGKTDMATGFLPPSLPFISGASERSGIFHQLKNGNDNEIKDDIILSSPVTISIGGDDESLDSDLDEDEDVRANMFSHIPEPVPHTQNFQRVSILDAGDESEDPDVNRAAFMLDHSMELRKKWISDHPVPPQDRDTTTPTESSSSPSSPLRRAELAKVDPKRAFRRRGELVYDIHKIPPLCRTKRWVFKMERGVYRVFDRGQDEFLGEEEGNTSSTTTTLKEVFGVRSFDEFVRDYTIVKHAAFCGPTASYAYKRLEVLSAKFNLHVLLNSVRENDAQKSVPHRDFYNIRKVDTHVHHSAAMNQKHLLRFIKMKLRTVPNEVVIYRDGKHLTLGDVFKSLKLTAYDLSIDTLDMHANDTFHRFDRFNLKYNPAGQSRLREIFLKTDNYLNGRYLAEITKEIFGDLEASKYQLVEWRVSIYGRSKDEWVKLARWFYENQLWNKHVRWLIQVPRLYHIYRENNLVSSFEEMMQNIFEPLFAATIDPEHNEALHYFLEGIVGFDSVDDESRPESGIISPNHQLPTPGEWDSAQNPPYGYWMYYMYANICTLNKLRAERGLRTYQFRPHCGEAGGVEHLISTYLLAHQINHGILLRKNPGLQYLFYLSQVGIAISPLSNNKLFLDYTKNPFPKYFAVGMNVSLSTDDPLMLHFTKDALLEEYSVAAQVWKLSSTDQSEIARLSVLQSGLELRYKRHFLGHDLSDIRETNVPEIRLQYRAETLEHEINEIKRYTENIEKMET